MESVSRQLRRQWVSSGLHQGMLSSEEWDREQQLSIPPGVDQMRVIGHSSSMVGAAPPRCVPVGPLRHHQKRSSCPPSSARPAVNRTGCSMLVQAAPCSHLEKQATCVMAQEQSRQRAAPRSTSAYPNSPEACPTSALCHGTNPLSRGVPRRRSWA